MDNKLFINVISEYAVSNYKKYNILPSLIIAQAILESGYGTSDLSVNANNYFGLNNYHDSVTAKYGTYKCNAPQEVDGKWVYKTEEFCLFKDITECFECLYAWYNRPKYERLHGVTNYKEACTLVRELGYATDSRYSEKLIRIIEENNLTKYDSVEPIHGYFVQIGFFENKAYAERQKEKAIALGFADCFIKEGDIK